MFFVYDNSTLYPQNFLVINKEFLNDILSIYSTKKHVTHDVLIATYTDQC